MSQYKLTELDPYLAPHQNDIDLRIQLYNDTCRQLLKDGETLSSFANGHLYFGFHPGTQDGTAGWFYREWAPAAHSIHLIGDFNQWDRTAHPLSRISDGVWEVFIPGKESIPHQSKLKIQIEANGQVFDRIPLYCKRVVQNPDTLAFDGQFWAPEKPFPWTDKAFSPQKSLPPLIYECHIGMGGEEERVATFKEFTEVVLPRVKKLGYNTVQLMAIMEHPYYGSFGYQVSNFFAASSRFGTPEELKELINTAHHMGIAVLLDVVHSHAARNQAEGIGAFDGTEYQFFHDGPKGEHPAWGTKLFNYGKPEVIHFLLSNLKFWLEEYHFDGFRFDGVTSMLYHDHGLGSVFDHYGKYFSLNTDTEAVVYLQLAAALCKEVKPDSILIAEDMSGVPGMCIPIEAGGIGFDYRLSMGTPDFWIRTLKEKTDEDWNIGQLWHELRQRRPQEKVIGYCESHDQALVGDKTIMFWLADKEMYWHMSRDTRNLAVDRAISLHKMIRLITCACAGEGYLTFMGNEFGHPEWVDFPREGNGWSYHYARRLWSLPENDDLLYGCLERFDAAMIALMRQGTLLENPSNLAAHHEDNKTLAFYKGEYLFVFNFHPSNDSVVQIHKPTSGQYETVLHTSWEEFGGFRPKQQEVYNITSATGQAVLEILMDRRSALVCKPVTQQKKKKK